MRNDLQPKLGMLLPALSEPNEIVAFLSGPNPGEPHSTDAEVSLSKLVEDSGVLLVAKQLCIYLDGAELMGREGPAYYPGGYISCYLDADMKWSFSSESRPMILELKADVPFGVLEQRLHIDPDESLSFSVHLWPSQTVDLCYFAACMALDGTKLTYLVGPGYIIPLPIGSARIFRGLFIRDRDGNFDLDSASFVAFGEVVRVPAHPQEAWEEIIEVEARYVTAIRNSQDDLFSDLWALTRYFMTFTALRSSLETRESNLDSGGEGAETGA